MRTSAFFVAILSVAQTATGRAAEVGLPEWEAGEGFRRARLAVASTGAGPVGFTTVPASGTGLGFVNTLAVADAARNNNLMAGSGTAAGDFDGDGRCDLYFCSISGTNALYRNVGNGRFEEVAGRAGVGCAGMRSTGAVFADVEGDGDLDLVVASMGQGVHLFENRGEGRFADVTASAGLGGETGSTSVALADVDGDADLDLYVTNYGAVSVLRSGGRPDLKFVNGQWVASGPQAHRFRVVDGRLEELGEPDVLYLNDGRGRFRPVPWDSEYFLDEAGKPKPAPWDYGLTVQLRDLNDDRAPEIYVCNDFQTVDRFWVNDGRGRFRALPRVAMRKQSFSSMGVDFADLDRDGHFDFVVSEMMSRDPGLRQRQIVGMEFFLARPGGLTSRPEVPRNTLFHNRGDGTYAELAPYSGVTASDWTWTPLFLDVDLDGYEDLLVGNGMMFDVQDRDVLDQVRALGTQNAASARTNLALYPPFLSPNAAWRNRHDLRFEDTSRVWGFDSTNISTGLALADFDRDGDRDVILNCLNAPALLCRNDATGPRVAVRLRGNPPNTQGVGALIRVTSASLPIQMQEMLCGGHYLSGDEAVRTFAAASPTEALAIEVRWRSGRISVVRGAEAGWLYEVREPTSPASPPPAASAPASEPWFRDVSAPLGHVHHEEVAPELGRQPLLTKLNSQLGPGVAWLDLDGDGQDELYMGAGRGGTLRGYRYRPDGTWAALASERLRPAPDDLTGLAGWAMADGRLCLVAGVANYESPATNPPPPFALFFLGPGGELREAGLTDLPRIPDSTGPVAVADVEGDGDLDLFLGGRVIPGVYPAPATSRLLRFEGGRFVADGLNEGLLQEVGLVSGATWSDLNADGFPELLLACEWGPIRVFANAKGRLREVTAECGLADAVGWWNGIATVDLDEDGGLDLVASNWGLNTGFEATVGRPLRVYYGDLGQQGTTDLLEAYYAPGLDEEVPRRGRTALTQAMPFLAEHFPTYRVFSEATLPELLRVLPTTPKVVTAHTLTNLVFLNRKLRFVARPLPPPAQFAPAFAAAVGDYDGDGHEDVFLSQNFFALRPEWPRLDAGRGLWLRGNGRGELTPVPGQTSGVCVYGEQRGAALGDFNADGRVDLVVTQNGAETRLFENVRGHPGLRVRLQGPPGNPWAIGAQLRLRFASEPLFGPVREIRAGSGYWSQDSVVQILASTRVPTQVQVLWPGGKRSTVPVPAGAREISIPSE